MGIKEKIKKKREELEQLKQRGLEKSLQLRDERKRKKQNKIKNMKPGARRTISEGIATKKNPWSVMKEEYSRRKYEREQKYKKNN